MYAEYRRGGTTPSTWTQNFLADGPLTRLRARLLPAFRNNPCWREIRARLKPGQRVLDAGCGTGAWVSFLAGEGYQGVGLDYAGALIEGNRAQFPAQEWIEGAIQAIPLPDDSLDGVVSWGVIEHDEAGPKAALEEFFRVLKPGGWAFVTVPYDSPTHRRSSERQFGMRRDGREFFQYFFNEVELADEVRKVGFEVDRCFPCSRHFAVAMPGLHVRLETAPRPVRAVVGRALDLYTRFDDDTINMVLAVAQKP